MASGTRSVSSFSLALPVEQILMSHLLSGFVNAQYRFIMNPTGDYTVHFADPDMYVALPCACPSLFGA